MRNNERTSHDAHLGVHAYRVVQDAGPAEMRPADEHVPMRPGRENILMGELPSGGIALLKDMPRKPPVEVSSARASSHFEKSSSFRPSVEDCRARSHARRRLFSASGLFCGLRPKDS